MLEEIGAENELALALAGYGRPCHRRGRIEAARDHLERALGIFERLGALGEPERTRVTLRDLARRRLNRALDSAIRTREYDDR